MLLIHLHRMYAVFSLVIPVLGTMGREFALPVNPYVCEVAEEGVALAGVEIGSATAVWMVN